MACACFGVSQAVKREREIRILQAEPFRSRPCASWPTRAWPGLAKEAKGRPSNEEDSGARS